jgi:hypothetical protein
VRELTAQQVRFVSELIRASGNGTEAAIRAGYSASSAAQRAYELRQNPRVQAAIHAEMRRTFGELGALALSQARLMLLDDKLPPGVRVDLMKAVWDRCGLGPVKEDGAEPIEDRDLRELSLSELEAIAVSLKFRRAPAAEQPAPKLVGEASFADPEQGPPAIEGE